MLFRMLRTQTSEHGTFRMGVAYDTGKAPDIIKTAKDLIAAGLAEEVTAEQLEKEKITAEMLAAASASPKKRVKGEVDVQAARAAEAAAKQEAEALKAERDALAARVAELEAEVAKKDEGQTQE